MLYRKVDGQGFLINCSCGCGSGLEFKPDPDEEEVILTINVSRWYSEQDDIFVRLMKKLKNIWFVLRGKEYCYSELVIKADEWTKFQEFITSTTIKNIE